MADPRICSVEGCDKPHYAKSYCSVHWKRWRAHGDPLADKRPKKKICTIAGCEAFSVSHGYCHTHVQRWRKHGDPLKGAFKPGGQCSVPGCRKPHKARGWCGMHYVRWEKKGDLNAGRVHTGKLLRFIQEQALKCEMDDCLIWPFGKTKNGYGYFSAEGKSAHSIVCELAHGPKPQRDFEVAHECGVRACCNPRHLRWSSRKRNHADKLIHDTHNRGERHSLNKLTEANVREIRNLRGKHTLAKIGEMFGVSQGTVAGIIHRRIWAWLD